MISYHMYPSDSKSPFRYAKEFKTANTNDVERVKKGIMGCVWSPIIWQQGIRLQQNFLRADWCVLDFDDGELTLSEACQIFCDRIHIIGTTKSHQVEKAGRTCDRFRVLLQFAEPITDLLLYRWNMHRMTKMYPADSACIDGARFFYPCPGIISYAANGYVEDVDVQIPERFDKPPSLEAYKKTGTLPPWTRQMLNEVLPEGSRNTTCYRIAKDLAQLGLDAGSITEIIIQSPTYKGAVSDSLLREIRQAIKSGMKKAELELKGGF